MKRIGLRKDEEGAIGIGTLIVFIALILVASIASAVILQTAYELENRAELTGKDAANSATGGVAIISTVGRVDLTAPTPHIDELYLIIGLSSGSEGVDLWGTVVVYQDDTNYEANVTHTMTTLVNTDNNNRILARGEMMNLTITGLNIEPGEKFTIRIIPPPLVPATMESYIAPESLNDRFIELI